MKTLSLLILLITTMVSANDYTNRPNNIHENGRSYVFVDFNNVQTALQYDYASRSVTARTRINLNQYEPGNIILDIKENPTYVAVNGRPVSLLTINLPGTTSQVRAINVPTTQGQFVIDIINRVSTNVLFDTNGVSSAFWMSDLTDRKYLEQYLPTNLEYDHYQMTLDVTYLNFPKRQFVFTNGTVSSKVNGYIVKYPSYFTTSSFYFHTAYEGRFDYVNSYYQSVDGRNLAITVYADPASSSRLERITNNTKTILRELENSYGPWPHQAVMIYNAGSGGMEYCGATMTSEYALGHELTHSYYARGVMPVNGNAGWIDEATASWRDGGYSRSRSIGFSSSRMAGHSSYERTTDRDAYSKGARFMSYIDAKLESLGGLKLFLRNFKDKYVYTSVSTDTFKSELENITGENLTELFDIYIYGRGFNHQNESVEHKEINNDIDKYHTTINSLLLQTYL